MAQRVESCGLKDKKREKTGQRRQSKIARSRREFGVAQPEQEWSKRQKHAKAPSDADAKSCADQEDSADQNKSYPCPKENQSRHSTVLSRQGAINSSSRGSLTAEND